MDKQHRRKYLQHASKRGANQERCIRRREGLRVRAEDRKVRENERNPEQITDERRRHGRHVIGKPFLCGGPHGLHGRRKQRPYNPGINHGGNGVSHPPVVDTGGHG